MRVRVMRVGVRARKGTEGGKSPLVREWGWGFGAWGVVGIVAAGVCEREMEVDVQGDGVAAGVCEFGKEVGVQSDGVAAVGLRRWRLQ